MKSIALLAALVGVCLSEPIEVNPNRPDGSGIDLSGTDLTNQFCALSGMRCPGEKITTKFSATDRQCLKRCANDLTCKSAFFSKGKKKCTTFKTRCTVGQLQKGDGVDLYRLNQKEECPSNRPLYSGPKVNFSNKYCKVSGKKCPGRDLYPKPQKLAPFLECLKKCSKLKTCGMVDFDGSNCHLKELSCSDSELVADSGMTNYIRLDNGVNDCSGGRTDAVGGGAAVVVPPAPKFCTRNFLNCFGRDIQFIPFVFSMSQCQDYCTANDACKSIWWSWTGACWLKKHACTNNELISSWGHDSVRVDAGGSCAPYQPHANQKYCVRRNKNCISPLRDIRLYLFVPTLERCEYYCSYHSDCKSIFYDTLIRSCYLKNKKCDDDRGFFDSNLNKVLWSPTGHDAYKC